jgi:hypothetical protein
MTHRAYALLAIATLLVVGGCDIFDDDDDGDTTISRVSYAGRSTGAVEGAVVITVGEHDSGSSALVAASGVLMPDGDDPIDTGGAYDPPSRMVSVDGGGYSLNGRLARGLISGGYTGPAGDGDFTATLDNSLAPFRRVLGSWDTSSTETLTCMDQPFENSETGQLRVRLVERQDQSQLMRLTRDTWDGQACDLDDRLFGSWSGNVYTETESDTVQFGDCTAEMEPTLRAEFSDGSFFATRTGTATIAGACEIGGTPIPAGTICEYGQTLTGTRCTDCWPAACEPS